MPTAITPYLCRNEKSFRAHIRRSRYIGSYLCGVSVRRPQLVVLSDLDDLILCGACGAEALIQGNLVFSADQSDV